MNTHETLELPPTSDPTYAIEAMLLEHSEAYANETDATREIALQTARSEAFAERYRLDFPVCVKESDAFLREVFPDVDLAGLTYPSEGTGWLYVSTTAERIVAVHECAHLLEWTRATADERTPEDHGPTWLDHFRYLLIDRYGDDVGPLFDRAIGGTP